MLIFVRWLLMLFKKEHGLITRYESTHPHFIFFIAVDAVISVALVFSIFQIFDRHTFEEMTHVGVVSMTPTEVVDHIKNDGVDAYWMGSLSGYEFALHQQVSGVVDVLYFPAGIDRLDDGNFTYEVRTYANLSTWNAHTHPLAAEVNTNTLVINKDAIIKINPTSMMGVIETFKDRPQIVAIAFAKRQSLASMMEDVASLRLVG